MGLPPNRPRILVALVGLLSLTVGACSWSTPELDPDLPEAALTSAVYAADGTLITELHGEENRKPVTYDAIPQVLIDAVIAIEDERYWLHNGVDVRGVIRAASENATAGGVQQGGSTITQQYVKNALVGDEQTVNRKVREAALALQLEQDYSKEVILELYLNTIYFGRGVYGVESASLEYFGTSVGDLDLTQAALLAGLIRSPVSTDPYVSPDLAIGRRDLVLDRMAELGYLTADESASAIAEPLVLAPEFDNTESYPAAHFVEEVKAFILDDPTFGETWEDRRDLLFTGGLRILTTIDLEQQTLAEEAVAAVLPTEGEPPEASVVSIEPGTGYVRAMVGGQDFFADTDTAKYNLATGKGRQAGSAFKPLVLAAALQNRVIPVTHVYDAPSTLEIPLPGNREWKVSNYGGAGGGRVTMVEATVRSYNTSYAQLIMDTGPDLAASVATDMGITTPLQAVPSLVLGSNDVTPLDMANSFATLANRGVKVDPVYVTRVTRPDGTVLWEHTHEQTKVLDAEVADQVTWVLSQVVRRGTGSRARLEGRDVAGKTGTAQDWKDAWFVGFTPELATSVWVGFPEGQISMTPPLTPIRVTGGSWPAEIWATYMEPALGLGAEEPRAFPAPPPSTTSTTALEDTVLAVQPVVGLRSDVAEEVLGALGFEVTVIEIDSAERPAGYVVAQSPPGGTEVQGGSNVILEITRRSATDGFLVPNVLGLTADAARSELRANAFAVEIITESGGDGVPETVWSQTPAGGELLAAGNTVTVRVNP
ncbi:MAG: PBP1A family penicillin-binding protein [Actinomycetia bacterium]|nr:PBP1A family penicillin-binding protein [Actinomycetes bacterium]MCP3911856.1 PBP1A family penicillin-binding protein [Actinomycetes bacterium]MCP4085722.1 PBP1A family penicillin-binding protein [Actinomycetes bacterium]